jgi:hypothetical protein
MKDAHNMKGPRCAAIKEPLEKHSKCGEKHGLVIVRSSYSARGVIFDPTFLGTAKRNTSYVSSPELHKVLRTGTQDVPKKHTAAASLQQSRCSSRACVEVCRCLPSFPHLNLFAVDVHPVGTHDRPFRLPTRHAACSMCFAILRKSRKDNLPICAETPVSRPYGLASRTLYMANVHQDKDDMSSSMSGPQPHRRSRVVKHRLLRGLGRKTLFA